MAYAEAVFEVAVTYLVQGERGDAQILLGEKLTGLGAGKFVAPGGKLEPGESARDAAVREVFEEVGITVAAADLEQVATFDYVFPFRPAWSQRSTAFIARRWEGEARGSAELAPAWYSVDALPLERMWADARLWLHRVLAGERIAVECSYAADNDSVAAWDERVAER